LTIERAMATGYSMDEIQKESSEHSDGAVN
jgi:hypothetical protein